VRCARCGNENMEGNRFCGMCGATLLTASPVASAPAQGGATRATTVAAPAAPAQPQSLPVSRTAAPVPVDAPIISGPSFLGLNDPPPRKRASLSVDPHAPSSSNLDYLLEDEEEHGHGGAGKFILILLALALAVGLGYLRWRNHGFAGLGSNDSKPAAAQTSDAPDTSSTTTTQPISSAPAPGSTGPAATAAAQPATDPATAKPAAASPTSASPASGSAASVSSAPGGSATNPVTETATASAPAATGDATATSGAGDSPAEPAAAPPVPAAKNPATTASNTPTTTSPKPHKAADEPARKPPAAIMAARPADPVTEAQKYLYGRGVAQDCDRGLRLLKPAVNQSNPKAMIEMGALYSAGLCTPHDLPTAYRWFALALRKDPDNQAVQTDLQKLWSEMTQPERQLAIKLSQ
jgi:hypothetical protein